MNSGTNGYVVQNIELPLMARLMASNKFPSAAEEIFVPAAQILQCSV